MPTVWVRDNTNPNLSFFITKSPENALQWIRQSYRPKVFLRLKLKPINTDNANPDPRLQSEDNSNYNNPVKFRSTANVIENGPNSIQDTNDKSACHRGKRPISNVSLSLPPTKYT